MLTFEEHLRTRLQFLHELDNFIFPKKEEPAQDITTDNEEEE